jgi:nitroimidazol reductase NimA-like FMN-containing flavoprotein (pyridoxamine 5'-phosphate oxidase superfamily)
MSVATASPSTSAPPASTSLAIRDLTQDECEQLLARHHVGRIAFTFRDRVDIEPIHYVFSDGAIYARTTQGAKLTVIAHHPWVAFEVDEVRGPFEWKSVVVKGTVYLVNTDRAPHSTESYQHAKHVLQTAMPAAFTADDPVPQRSIILRIALHEWEGRASTIVTIPGSGT